ncbi:DUF3291 domain-containing protein [Roseovarius rhodophyticola]|uniref:DUF3291 domain-containing protein n=1 Tax=Roseovarius rhodophyticola TaxID=3080827 RepID=A0ABZ2TD95_9RHOB|nr:DUF3291 domain-containing protein [Roseovarius sp. W115]MDV2931447.1 DUF3291 domain-containing protein [Roseovarius sp. W115]
MLKSRLHLAQFNIGRMTYDLDDPRAADFVAGIDMLNRIAERSDGFVWKYETDVGGVVQEDVDNDPRMLVNLTVWESIEALRQYVWKTLHKHFLSRKREWFTPLGRAHFVMWWVQKGQIPTLKQAMDRLDHLRQNGDSEYAFGWSHLNGGSFMPERDARTVLG